MSSHCLWLWTLCLKIFIICRSLRWKFCSTHTHILLDASCKNIVEWWSSSNFTCGTIVHSTLKKLVKNKVIKNINDIIMLVVWLLMVNGNPRFIFLSALYLQINKKEKLGYLLTFFIYIWRLPQFIIFLSFESTIMYVSVYVCIYDERLRCSKIRQWNDPSIFCIMPPLLGQEFLIDSTFNVFLCWLFQSLNGDYCLMGHEKEKDNDCKISRFCLPLKYISSTYIYCVCFRGENDFFALELRKIYCKNI